MEGVWKEVDGLNADHAVSSLSERPDVPCLCGWIAADIHDSRRKKMCNTLNYLRVHSASRGIKKYDIGRVVFVDPLCVSRQTFL